jgi:PAS domain S-box-containing protein
MATLYFGQVLHEPPDMVFFRAQALECGFDEEAYLEAILDASPIGIGWSKHGKVEYINRKFTELFGYQLEELDTIDQMNRLAFPDEALRHEIVDPWVREVAAAKAAGGTAPVLEAPVVCKGGRVRYGMVNISWIGQRRLINFSDITVRWQAERQNKARNKVLEVIAKGASLAQTLNTLILSLEEENPGILGSILLRDDIGWHLLNGAAASLPDFYNQAINGIEIGEGVGSCGTAAFTRQRFVVSDIQHDPYWEGYQDLALRAGLAACWSEPVFSSKGHLLGTFAIYI